MFRHLGLNMIEIELMIDEYADSFFDLILMKIFNRYFATHTQQQRDELEKTMSEIKETGDAKKQEKVMDILKNTMINNPDLADEIRTEISKLYAEIFFDFMKNATPDGQVEILTYMLNKKRELKDEGQKIKEMSHKKKLLTPTKKTEPN